MSDPVSDAVIADAAGSEASAAQRASRSRFGSDTGGQCSNCGTPLKGRICHSCGQNSDSFHRPVWSLLWEVLDGLIGLDGRLWRTLPALMFRPGYLTRKYLEGVRARYVQPFRLYLFASVVFFLIVGLGNSSIDDAFIGQPVLSEEDRAVLEEQLDEIAAESPEASVEIQRVIDQLTQDEAEPGNPADITLDDALTSEDLRAEMRDNVRRQLLPEYYPDADSPESSDVVVGDPGDLQVSFETGGLDGLPLAARERLARQLERVIDDPDLLFGAMQRWLPRLLFVLLPIYALILAVGQVWRRGFYFYDHLIVSLHLHAFLFVLFILLQPVGYLVGGLPFMIFFIWSNYYLYRIHRVVYEHGRFMSVIRTLTLDITYLVVLVLASVVLVFVGLLFA
ncbi:DUF3667 domain-containing protein [Hyphobacterium sp.]|uniref:DUF3667 domain-containing protein n=1 Tax=Hyphobacterium sp. TaxID=2004662 RepID=UPI003B5279E9